MRLGCLGHSYCMINHADCESDLLTWAAWYNTWLLIQLTTKGVVFSFLLFQDCESPDIQGVPVSLSQV